MATHSNKQNTNKFRNSCNILYWDFPILNKQWLLNGPCLTDRRLSFQICVTTKIQSLEEFLNSETLFLRFYHIFNPALPETFWGHSKSFVKLEIRQNVSFNQKHPISTRMSEKSYNTKVRDSACLTFYVRLSNKRNHIWHYSCTAASWNLLYKATFPRFV